MASQSRIPSFFLFGEPPRVAEGKFLHLEALDDRSRPNDWNIRPHAHADLNHVFHIAHGGGRMSADGRAIAFVAPCLLIAPARVVHGFVFEAETKGSVLTIADSYLRDLVAREAGFEAVFRQAVALALGPDHGTAESLERLARELSWAAPGHGAAVEAQLLTILVDVLRLRARVDAPGSARPSAHAALVARFRELVEAGYRTNRTLEAYASGLGVSVWTLGAACRSIASASPLSLVQDRKMLEARRALLYSNMTVAEVAYHLGFDDPAYFTRVFTKHAGVSPRGFRDNALA